MSCELASGVRVCRVPWIRVAGYKAPKAQSASSNSPSAVGVASPSPLGSVLAVAFGSARAMGGMLLACGAKGKRAALPNTCVMLHHPAGAARGQASDINNEGRELLKIREKINQMVSGATGQPVEKIRQDIRRDFHLTAEQALDYGVIDKVLYKRRGAGAR